MDANNKRGKLFMSWLSKILPPKIKEDSGKSNVPEGLWCKCDNCNEILYHTDLDNNLKVCPKCDHHHTLSARERLDMLLDTENRIEIATNVMPVDILNFTDSKKYSARLKQAQKKLKENDALVVMSGTLNKQEVVIASFEFKFIGGSMGSVVGEKFVRGVREALAKNCPFICITFIGDVVIAEPMALIGFAGPRVIEQTVREKLPEGFQRSDFLLEKGALDMIVRRHDLKEKISKIITMLLNKE